MHSHKLGFYFIISIVAWEPRYREQSSEDNRTMLYAPLVYCHLYWLGVEDEYWISKKHSLTQDSTLKQLASSCKGFWSTMWLKNVTRTRLVVAAAITAFSIAATVMLNHQQVTAVTAVRITDTDTAVQEFSSRCQYPSNNTGSPASKPRFGHYIEKAKTRGSTEQKLCEKFHTWEVKCDLIQKQKSCKSSSLMSNFEVLCLNWNDAAYSKLRIVYTVNRCIPVTILYHSKYPISYSPYVTDLNLTATFLKRC